MGEKPFAYLIWKFPETYQTFVANEIRRVEDLGLPLTIYSCTRPVEKVEYAAVREIKSPVQYLPESLWTGKGEIWRSLLAAWAHDRHRFGRALIRVARYSVRERSINAWRRFLQDCCLAERLRKDGVRHVHAHFAGAATERALSAGMLTGIPFSFTGHAIDIYTAKRRPLKEKIDAARFAVTCTAASLSYLHEVAPESQRKLHLVYHGVDVEKFAWREEEPVSGLPLILSVGRLVEKKGYDDLIAALALLRDRGVAFRAQLVGDGPEWKTLEVQVKRLSLEETVSLTGVVDQETLVGVYRQASVFALPCASWRTVTAMACPTSFWRRWRRACLSCRRPCRVSPRVYATTRPAC